MSDKTLQRISESVPTHLDSQLCQNSAPYQLSLCESGCTIYFVSPFGGKRAEFEGRQTEVAIDIQDWENIKAAVDRLFAENTRRAIETNRLDAMIDED